MHVYQSSRSRKSFLSPPWARREACIVVPFVRRRLRRGRLRTQPFGYYTNMVQQLNS